MNNLNEVVEKIKNGEIGIFPTDTAFGIGCRMDDINAVERIYELRKRPANKALIVLVSSIEMAREYVEMDDNTEEILRSKYWPGGLTVVFKCRKDKVPEIVRAGGDSLAIRMPDHSTLREVIAKAGVPIIAPSANFSGFITPFKLEKVDKNLLSSVDFVLEGVCTIGGVSTIVDSTLTPWRVIRQGVVEI